jgi:hypothetical protein
VKSNIEITSTMEALSWNSNDKTETEIEHKIGESTLKAWSPLSSSIFLSLVRPRLISCFSVEMASPSGVQVKLEKFSSKISQSEEQRECVQFANQQTK